MHVNVWEFIVAASIRLNNILEVQIRRCFFSPALFVVVCPISIDAIFLVICSNKMCLENYFLFVSDTTMQQCRWNSISDLIALLRFQSAVSAGHCLAGLGIATCWNSHDHPRLQMDSVKICGWVKVCQHSELRPHRQTFGIRKSCNNMCDMFLGCALHTILLCGFHFSFAIIR